MKRHNFNAGPSILPRTVIEDTAKAILNLNDSGLSLMEISHRSKDFQSVIDLFINLKQRGVKEEDFPTGLLLVSDGELNPARYGSGNNSTNFQTAIRRLKEAGFSEEYVKNFKLIMWDIPNYYYGSGNAVKFEDFADAPNFFYMSGYDPSAVAFIMGTGTMKRTPKNAEELFMVAMDQSLLNKLKVVQTRNKKKK